VGLQEALTGLQDPYLRASDVCWVYTIELDDGIFSMPG